MITIFAIAGSITFGIASVLYILIVLGFPLGEFAMGGKYKVFPVKYRIIGGISILVQWFAIIILLQTGDVVKSWFSFKVTKGICTFFAIYLSINVFMNFLSRSKKEKLIVGPLSLLTTICYWIVSLMVNI